MLKFPPAITFILKGSIRQCCSKPKTSKDLQLLCFGTEIFWAGPRQFRLQYQSFRFHLIWGRNGTEMEPTKKIQTTPRKPCTETLVSRSRNQNRSSYQNRYRGTAGAEASVPKSGMKWKICTVPTLVSVCLRTDPRLGILMVANSIRLTIARIGQD